MAEQPGAAPKKPETHVLSALKRRYARVLSMPDSADDLAHLAAVIRMFSPDEDLAAIQPVRPYKANRERWNRTALNILKDAPEPLRARELARLVMEFHGVDPDDRARLISISCGLQIVLGRLAERGFVRITGKPRRWALARD